MTLDAETEALTGELADELEVNAVVDPRAVTTRFSLLKKMSLSPAHYREAAQYDQDDSIAARFGVLANAKKRSDALAFGNACHLMLMGEARQVATFPGRRAGKVWDAFRSTAADRGYVEILSAREYALAEAVTGAVRAHPIAMRLLFVDTQIEKRIDWTWMGKQVRSTPDARSPRHVVDLKTAVSSEPGAFVRAAIRLHYHAQAALYADAIVANKEPRPGDAYVIAVEKSRPHPVTILRFTPRALDYGAMLCRSWMERLLVCEASNEWPPYLAEIGDFDIDEAPFELEIDGARFEL